MATAAKRLKIPLSTRRASTRGFSRTSVGISGSTRARYVSREPKEISHHQPLDQAVNRDQPNGEILYQARTLVQFQTRSHDAIDPAD